MLRGDFSETGSEAMQRTGGKTAFAAMPAKSLE